MAINNPRLQYECRTCAAAWSSGFWTWGCEECGGGAMQKPCEQCLGQCGAAMQRAAMDSNDSGRAHFFGSCGAPGDLKEKATTAMLFDQAARSLDAPRLALRCELCDWSSDDAWRSQPKGPPALRVLLDAIEDRGFRVSPRTLAHALFGHEEPLPELPRLRLERFWQSAGTLVLLEPLSAPTVEWHANQTRLCRIHRVLSHGHSWLTRERGAELPFADRLQLPAKHRYLAVVIPTNMVAGMLIDEALDTGVHELELIDLHRRLIAQGEESITRRR